MKKITSLLLLLSILFFSCGNGGGAGGDDSFSISYNKNGAESGTVPASQKGTDSSLIIQDNTGVLARNGYLFDNWNTKADGSGKNYAPGTKYQGKDLVLFAKWAAIFTYEPIPSSPAPALESMQKAPANACAIITGLTARGRQLVNIVIPETIDGYRIISIADNAFEGYSGILSIIIPSSVTSIGERAFAGCSGLTAMTIPATVTNIGSGAFSDCSSLASLEMQGTTPPALGAGALDGCPVTVNVPSGTEGAYQGDPSWVPYAANISGGGAGGTTQINVTADAKEKYVGDADPALTYTFTPNPLPDGVSITGELSREAGEDPGYYAIIQNTLDLSVENGGNYELVFTGSSLHISALPVNEGEVIISGMSNGSVSADKTDNVAAGETVTLTVSTDPGYRFGSIDVRDSSSVVVPTSEVSPGVTYTFTMPTSDVTVSAVFNRLYSITYNSNGASSGSAPSSQQGITGEQITVQANTGSLACDGYVFGGWNTQTNGEGDNYTAGSDKYTLGSSNVILYAKWNINSYSVTYNGNGNSSGNVPDSQSGDYNSSITLRANSGNLQKTGYRFGGWGRTRYKMHHLVRPKGIVSLVFFLRNTSQIKKLRKMT